MLFKKDNTTAKMNHLQFSIRLMERLLEVYHISARLLEREGCECNPLQSPSGHEPMQRLLRACSSLTISEQYSVTPGPLEDIMTPSVAEIMPGAVRRNPVLKMALRIWNWPLSSGGKRLQRSKAEKQKQDASAAADDGLFQSLALWIWICQLTD